MVDVSLDLWNVVKDTVKFFKKRKNKKLPVGQFIKRIEGKYKIPLSKQSKEDILNKLQKDGTIMIVKSRYGKKYVIIGKIV